MYERYFNYSLGKFGGTSSSECSRDDDNTSFIVLLTLSILQIFVVYHQWNFYRSWEENREFPSEYW